MRRSCRNQYFHFQLKLLEMKSTIILLTVLLGLTANAQKKTDSIVFAKPVVNKASVPLKTTPTVLKPVTPPAPKAQITQSKETDTPVTLTDADYFLAGAVIKISTGGDNKEANTSTAFFQLRPKKSMAAVAYNLNDYANELPVNQTAELRLERVATLTSAQNSLQYFKQNGLSVVIGYCNKNFCTDAWKINSITVTLEFKDANGNPAVNGYASKAISFPMSSGTLGFIAGCNPFWVSDGKTCVYSDQLQKMVLKTDEYFNPLPAKLMAAWIDDTK
jgi:hypothetical protein